MHWDYAVILIFLGLAVPYLGRRRIRRLMQLPHTTKIGRLTLYASTIAFQWLATGIVLWRAGVHGLRAGQLAIAIPNPRLAILVAILLAALILANQLFSLRRIAAHPSDVRGLLPQLALKIFPQDDVERLAYFALVLTVASCEELIYRGFVQALFDDLSGGMVLAGIAGSSVLFAMAHLYQGRGGFMSTLSVGLLFSAVRAWTGSLIAPFVGHFVADVSIGFLAPSRLRRAMKLTEAADASHGVGT